MSNARDLSKLVASGLTDYQTGTWTVEISDAATGGNVSPTTVAGSYVKVGDLVTCWFLNLNNIDTTSLTAGNLLRVSLPFVLDGNLGVGSVVLDTVTFPAGTNYITPTSNNPGTQRCLLRTVGSGVADGTLAVSAFQNGVSDISFFCFTYKTTA